MSGPDWREDEDCNGNTVWIAVAPYNDDIFEWRLIQTVIDNRHIWMDDSCPELREPGPGRFWLTLKEAKADIQKDWDTILDSNDDVAEQTD